MQLEEFSQNRFVRNYVRDRWLIGASTLVVVALAGAYVGLLHKPMYKSEAKVWIKDTSTTSYLGANPSDAPSYLRPLTNASNPVATQSQILTSYEMEDFLANYVLLHEARQRNVEPTVLQKPSTRRILKVKTDPNSDVLQVQLLWHDPMLAKNMLHAALSKFDEINLDINRGIHTKKRAYLETQLTELQDQLAQVRDKIREYQSGSMAVDVDAQTQELVRLRANLVAQMEAVQAARNNNAASASALQRQLAMNPTAALTAVALGSGNESLVKMRSDLAVLQQQHAHDSVRLAPTNPQLVALKQQIDALESQIRDEVRQTAGVNYTNGPRIYDNVRSQLVQDMTASRARSIGLGSEAASLAAAIDRVDSALREIPGNKFALANLQEEERALSAAFDEMKKRQIEASIKEAETPSNVFVVDAPTLPKKASFPAPLHLMLLSGVLGLLGGLGVSTLKTYAQDLAEGTEAVEEATRGKVLGVLPWLLRPLSASAAAERNIVPISDVAIKNLLSALRIEAGKHQAEVIAFTSSSMGRPQISTVYNLARRMARLGHSVALIDADFRPSGLLEMTVSPETGMDLSDLILGIDDRLRKGLPVLPEDVVQGLSQDEHGVRLGLNRHAVDQAYDFFASRGFQHMIRVLKSQFDWVFIDTPSAAFAPEFLAVSPVSDGVVLFVDHQATFSTLRKIARRIRQTQTPLIGSVIREQNPLLERDHQEYQKWRDMGRPGSGGGLESDVPVGATAQAAAPVADTSGSVALKPRRVEFMGAQIDALTMRETVSRIAELIDRREMAQHVVVNVAKLMTMRQDAKLRDIVNNSTLVNADGAGIIWGAKLLGIDIPERVAGIDLMQELIENANRRGDRLFFLGAEEDVVRDVVTIYKRRYPNLQICGYRNGYYRPGDELAIATQIRNARPDILFVALGSPQKEKFISEFKDVMEVPFVMGVGGSFDVVAGKVKRAPLWMQNAGLEWCYRLAQEPGRLWKRYLVTNAEYGWALLAQAVKPKARPVNG